MALNKHVPSLVILPEDDANRQILNGFIRHLRVNDKTVSVLPPAGGWTKVLSGERIEGLLNRLKQFDKMRLLLVIDFDRQFESRYEIFKDRVGEALFQRTYLLGTLSDPESLKKSFGQAFEKIGESLAEKCDENDFSLWENEFLRHNLDEVRRLSMDVKPFLFLS